MSARMRAILKIRQMFKIRRQRIYYLRDPKRIEKDGEILVNID
jgi:hypothetical protein